MEDENDIAIIPFSYDEGEEHSGLIGRGVALELNDWLSSGDAESHILTSTWTEDDGRWRKLVTPTIELSPELATEIVESARQDPETEEPPEIRAIVSGNLNVSYGDDGEPVLTTRLDVTDAAGAYRRGRAEEEVRPGDFPASIVRLFRNVAERAGLDDLDDYQPGTESMQAWLKLLLTRALKLAAEVGAMDESVEGVYEPALEAVKIDPGLHQVRKHLAELATVLVLQRGFDAAKAAAALDQVTTVVGDDWHSLLARGRLQSLLLNHDKAAKAFCSVVSGALAAPELEDRAAAALTAGCEFNRAGRHTEAQRVLNEAMKWSELKVDAIIESAAASAALNEPLVAERLWRRALELDGSSIAAHVHLAHLYRSQAKPEQAADMYSQLMNVADLPREVYADAAEFFVQHKLHETAVKAAERFTEDYPGEAIAHVLHASSLNALGRHKRARKAVEQAELCAGVDEIEELLIRQRRFADHPEAEKGFVKAAEQAILGDADQAEKQLRGLIEAYPDFHEAELFLGIAVKRQRRPEEARDILESLRVKRKLPGIDRELTGLYSELGEPAKALKFARLAMDAEPEDPRLMGNYAAALLENGELDQALKYAQRAGAILPDDPLTEKLLEIIAAQMTKRGLIGNLRAVARQMWEALHWRK